MLLFETPTYDKKDLKNIPTSICILGDQGSHNELRIKFLDNNEKIPLRMNVNGIKLDNSHPSISSLHMNSDIFYKTCEWFICNRDIINTYFTYTPTLMNIRYALDVFLHQRDNQISKNKENYLIPYTKTKNGCVFNTLLTQIPINVDMKNMAAKLEQEQVDEAIKPFLQNAGLL